MKLISTVSLFIICALPFLAAPCLAQNGISFFYLVFQWPGSECSTKQGCCFPNTGKPAKDFTIGGMWPFHFDGTSPTNCKSHIHFHMSKVSDLTKRLQQHWPSLACPSSDSKNLWAREWQKFGSCSESVLNQHKYFEAALRLKEKTNLLQILNNAGIKPNGAFYDLGTVTNAIQEALIYLPGMVCNTDKYGNSQLYQIHMCTDTKGTKIIDCPGIPMGKCRSKITFPTF